MTRTYLIMMAANASRDDMAQALACDRSTINRLIAGRAETPPQAKLLDYLARECGLDHLTAEAFAASQSPAPSRGGRAEAAPLAGSADAGEGGGTAPHLGGA